MIFFDCAVHTVYFRVCYVDAVMLGLVCIPPTCCTCVCVHARGTRIHRSIRDYYQIEREMHAASRS